MNFIKKKINENKIKKVLGEFNESFQNSNYDECIKKIGILEDLGYSDIYYLKGIAFYVKGDYDESIDCLKKSNKYSKKDSFCQNLLIDNYVLLGKYLELDYTIKRLRNKISGMQELYFKINCLQHMKIDYFENNKEEISQLGTAIVIKKEDFNQQYQFFYEICHIFSNAIIAAGECINQCVHYCKQSSTQFKNFKIDNNIKHFIIEYDKWTHILSFSRNIGGILLNSKIKSYNYFVFYEEIWPNKLEKFYSGKYITQILNLIFQLNSPNLHIKIDKFDCICNILEAFLQIEPRAISQIINHYFDIIKDKYLEKNQTAIIYVGYVYSEIIASNYDQYGLKDRIEEIWNNDYKYDLEKVSTDIRLTRHLSYRAKMALDNAEISYAQTKGILAKNNDYSALALQFFRVIEIELNEKLINPLVKSIDDDYFNNLDTTKFSKTWEGHYRNIEKIKQGQKSIQLGSVRTLLNSIVKVKSSNSFGNELKDKTEKLLSDEGKEALGSGKIEEIINNNILNKYRIPGAHTGYIPYSKACEARKYVLESLLELEKYFMMKGDVM